MLLHITKAPFMDNKKKEGRYERIYKQLEVLMNKSNDKTARMCTIASILHHKMEDFFWTGFYLLNSEGALVVRTYQGPVACMELEKNVGVCWAGINTKESVVVANVEQFPGHIACDSRSKSEIVVPVKNEKGDIVGVLDVDSDKLNTFNEVDQVMLEKIVELLNS